MTTHQLIRGGSLRYVHVHYISLLCLRSGPMFRVPSHRGLCAKYLRTCGSKNVDDVTLIAILSLYHVGLYQINLF